MKNTARDIMELYKSSDKNEIAQYFPLLMNERLTCIFQASIEPKLEDYQEVADMLNTLLELNIEAGHVKVLLDFYPYVKAKISHNPATDETMRDMILDAVSDFFLGCPWPEYEENINMDDYIDALAIQFKGFSAGFEIMSQLVANQHQSYDVTKMSEPLFSSEDWTPQLSDADAASAISQIYRDEEEEEEMPKRFISDMDEHIKMLMAKKREDDEEYGEIKFNKETYKGINESYLGLYGEDMLPPEEIDRMLTVGIKSEIAQFGLSDTCVRENMAEEVMKFFIGKYYDERNRNEDINLELNDVIVAYSKAFKEKKDNGSKRGSEDDCEQGKVTLSPETYKEINGHLNLFGEDMLPPEEIDKILGDEYIKSQIVAWGIDTVVRDNLFELFVDYFLPEKYSEYGISYQERSDKLDEAVKAYVKAFKEKNKKDLQS